MRKWLTGIAIGLAGFAIGAGAVLVVIYYRADLAASQHLAPIVERLVATRAASDPQGAATNGLETAGFALDSDDLLQEILRLPSDFEQTLTLYALLQNADGDDLERLLDQARLLRPAHEGQAAASILYVRYADGDPHAAVERIVAGGQSERRFLRSTFAAWAKYDIDAALARADELPPELRQLAGGGLIWGSAQRSRQRRQEIADRFGLQYQLDWMDTAELIGEAPAAAWQRALASRNSERLLSEAGLAWVERDPVSALNAAAALADADHRRSFTEVLMTRWASIDPDAAMHWGLSQDGQTRLPLLRGVAAGIARNSAEAALGFALELAGRERREAAQMAFGLWARKDPVGAAEALGMLDDGTIFAASSGTIVDEWAKQDPRAAFEWFASNDAGTRDYSHYWTISHTLGRIAQSDPELALELASGLAGEARGRGLSAVVNTWAESDPYRAAAWLEDAVEADLQVYGQLAAEVARGLAADDPQAAFRWAQRQPTSAQMSAMTSLASFVSERSLNEAARLVDRIEDAGVRAVAASQLAWGWARSDPPEAVRWVTGQVAAGEREPLLDRVFDAWVRTDRNAAIAAMRRLRRGDRDAAAASIVRNLIDRAPQLAERIYKDIRDDAMRKQAAMALYWHFRRSGSARADRYLEDAGLEDADVDEPSSVIVSGW